MLELFVRIFNQRKTQGRYGLLKRVAITLGSGVSNPRFG